MNTRLLALIVTLLVSGCASRTAENAGDAATRDVSLRSGAGADLRVRYDFDSGRCSEGSIQLATKEQVDALIDGWKQPAESGICSDAAKQSIPSKAAYPEAFAKLQKGGSARVLVRLEADGRVASAHAVCATDAAFGQAAVETAKRIAFDPSKCDGVGVRSAFLLPFDYDWK